MKVDVVSVYTNATLFEKMEESLKKNSGGYEICLIGLDNSQGRYASAAEAYTYALESLCTAETVIFCHQDIVFGEDSVAQIMEHILRNEDVILGAAGAIQMEKAPYNFIISAIQSGGRDFYDSLKIGEVRDVFTLDECLIAMRRRIFRQVAFDTTLCDGWHFYAVDLCLQCHQRGIKVQAVGIRLQHLSLGKRNEAYRRTEKRLAVKWRKQYRMLVFTTGWTYTKRIPFLLLRILRRLKRLH